MALKRSNLKLDSPVNNFATINSLDQYASTLNLSEGNLKIHSNQADYRDAYSTMAMSSGKWYCEMYAPSSPDQRTHLIGACSLTAIQNLDGDQGDSTYTNNFSKGSSYYYEGEGNMFSIENENKNNYGGAGYVGNSAIVGVFLNLDENFIRFFLNGSLRGTISNILNDSYFFSYNYQMNNNRAEVYMNFGQNPDFCGEKTDGGNYSDANGRGLFYYKPPWGALALCSANLQAMDEAPSQNFKSVLWTGDGSDSIKVPVGFSPDLIWMKARNDAKHNNLWDSVRGLQANKYLISNGDWEENGTDAQNVGHPELDPDDDKAFLAKEGTSSNVWTTNSGIDYVAWTWKAGGAPDEANTAMVDGVGTTVEALQQAAGSTETPTAMSVNTKAGFSIVKYVGTKTSDTGATATPTTIPHGLTQRPDLVITKAITATTYKNWNVWHSANQSGKAQENNQIFLNGTGANNAAGWQRADTGMTDTVFCPARHGWDDDSGHDYIAYVWHSVPGYSKFGSYVGNGSSDGPNIVCGFRPAWLMVKKSTGSGSWTIIDTQRYLFNAAVPDKPLYADKTDPESSSQYNIGDILSNSFKLRYHDSAYNSNDQTYIYMAFAEKPPTVPEKVKYNTSMKERHSLYFNGSSHLNKSMSSGSKTRFTYSCWLKRSIMHSGGSDILWFASNGVGYALICFTNNQLRFYDVTNNNTGDENADIRSSHVFRDQSSFVHVVLSVDASQATLDSKVKIYVNGKLNPLDGSSFFNDTVLSTMNTSISTNIGNQSDSIYMNGYLSNVYFIDDNACSADYFGKYENGKWVAKEYEGGYGNNGFHLDFAPDNMEYNSSGNLTIVKDSSGNGNHWSASTS